MSKTLWYHDRNSGADIEVTLAELVRAIETEGKLGRGQEHRSDTGLYCAKWPITSIRRAITNLTNDGELVKHDRMRMGDYGKDNHTWSLGRHHD